MQWAIGDVHGCFPQLMQLLLKIKFNPSDDQLFFIGDLVDRGAFGREVVEFVRDGLDKGRFFLIRGNHEDEWRQAFHMGLEDVLIRKYPETLSSFDRDGLKEFAEWTEELPLFIERSDAILVHAGMTPSKHFQNHTDQEKLWCRSMEVIPEEFRDGRVVIHGHTPLDKPLIRRDRINIDTGCVFGGELTAVSIDHLKDHKIIIARVPGHQPEPVAVQDLGGRM